MYEIANNSNQSLSHRALGYECVREQLTATEQFSVSSGLRETLMKLHPFLQTQTLIPFQGPGLSPADTQDNPRSLVRKSEYALSEIKDHCSKKSISARPESFSLRNYRKIKGKVDDTNNQE